MRGYTKVPNKQFCCLWNLEIFHKIYLRLLSVTFLSFQSLLHFRKSKLGVTPSFLMKSSYEISQNQIFNKKQKSCASFFLVLCLTPFVTVSNLLSQIYVCTSFCWLFNAPARKWWHQQKCQHIFKVYAVNVKKLCAKLAYWTNIKQIRKGVPVASSNQPIWPQKIPTLVGSLSWQVWT